MRAKVGLIGYGAAGAAFHAPLVNAEERLELAAVATSREGQPGVRTVSAPEAIFTDPLIDLVVIATPNRTHYPLAKAALLGGKHVLVDKPFTIDVAEADELIALAAERHRMLSVFHNRRWDGDFLTVRQLIRTGQLGELMLFKAAWDRFRPAIKPGWREQDEQGAGLLADLGPHLVDQALLLFGMPDSLSADLAAQRSGAVSDDYFSLTLHYGRARVQLAASNMVASPRPRFAVHGTSGSFVKHGLDPQESELKAGKGPADPGFGEEPEHAYGLFTYGGGGERRIPTERGRYSDFYRAVAAAILDGAPAPVDPRDARDSIRIIELARQSVAEGRTMPFRP